ncbi:hypothetical protein LguiB_009575 [Lonicera macranthoides]
MASGFETHISCEVHQSLMDTGLGKFGAHITEGSARSERLVVMRFSIVGIATTKLRLSIDMRFLAMNGKRVICSMCNTELDVSIYALLKFIQHANETNNIFLLAARYLLVLISMLPLVFHFHWDCIALLDDVDSCDEAEFRMQIRQLALTSLELLNAAIFDKECEPRSPHLNGTEPASDASFSDNKDDEVGEAHISPPSLPCRLCPRSLLAFVSDTRR